MGGPGSGRRKGSGGKKSKKMDGKLRMDKLIEEKKAMRLAEHKANLAKRETSTKSKTYTLGSSTWKPSKYGQGKK